MVLRPRVLRPVGHSTDAVVRPDISSIDAVVRPDVGSTDAVVRPGLGSIGFGSNRQKQAIIRKKSEVILAVGLVGTEGATLGS
ncbi:hypothetical protein L6452_09536 [Arctium lappa]|uniref:Uncharacterized protein n=1 Tax=Arctium lappa TaxID=4217 RepID=A0ACB9DKS5_ARCLA|nr:hypothetical protein L6452_09536 [Arctium lappa]